ncbi:unnamed protein product [Hydatigera taeniaeformis]|uniref:N-acetyltransferase domain-containing protein n=1 Tax=Hydatigena taeniaeformis TaxID=6205 RepID=A0A0R3WSC0_HYDTA|nr:unnamed protein product [Hydatigera taeniaeformis]
MLGCVNVGSRRCGVGTRLARGYHEEAEFDPEPPTFSHLCFVVHGMGQKYLKGSIITACDG